MFENLGTGMQKALNSRLRGEIVDSEVCNYYHVKKFISEKVITTNSCQNMNDERKYSYHNIFFFLSYQTKLYFTTYIHTNM